MSDVITHSSPGAVLDRLAAIEVDLAYRMNEYETAADSRARLIRDWEKRLAYAMVKAPGSNEAARKAAALITAIEVDDLYERLKAAEAAYDALKVVTRLLEARATIGMSILRSQGRS